MLKNKIKIIASIAIVGIVAGSIFYACKKDESLTAKTEDVSAVKEQKDVYGVWVYANFKNAEPTGKATITGDPICTKVETEKLWDDTQGRYTYIRTTTYLIDCLTGRIISSSTVGQKLTTSAPPASGGEIGFYRNMNNFDFYVNDKFVTADFMYVEPIEVVDDKGVVNKGEYRITYEDIIQLFHRINENGNWMN